MNRLSKTMVSIISVFALFLTGYLSTCFGMTQNYRTKIPVSLTTPDKVNTNIGVLNFKDGYPIGDTVTKVQDELDYIHGVEAFMNSTRGISVYAIRKGMLDIGVKDGDVLLFSKLLDARSLLLTGNADTVYFISFLDLSKGPVIFEAPPDSLGLVDDMWFRWVTDFGLPGAERGRGGKYLLVGPGYKGSLPEGGYIVRHSRTNHVILLGRSFLTNNDPAPTVAVIKKTLKIYPYIQNGSGTSIGSYLNGKAKKLNDLPKPMTPRFVEGTNVEMNTIPPNDFNHYVMLDKLVQMEPASALDPEIAGQFAAIGIVKGKPFAPDARMKKILNKAVAFANAATRTISMGSHPVNHFKYYGPNSDWYNMLFQGGYTFIEPPPMITEDGRVKPLPESGSKKLHSRASFFYMATGVSPAMCMRLVNVGSQYLMAARDSDGNLFDGAKTYKVVLPKNIPAARFWSITVYDNQTRSMLQTPQLYPRAGSQSFPSPAAKTASDGTTTVYFSPTQPKGVSRGNWIQTDPKKGFFLILRLYSPLKPFFDKTWRPSEIELVK